MDAERMVKERERLQVGLAEATEYHKEMRQLYFGEGECSPLPPSPSPLPPPPLHYPPPSPLPPSHLHYPLPIRYGTLEHRLPFSPLLHYPLTPIRYGTLEQDRGSRACPTLVHIARHRAAAAPGHRQERPGS